MQSAKKWDDVSRWCPLKARQLCSWYCFGVNFKDFWSLVSLGLYKDCTLEGSSILYRTYHNILGIFLAPLDCHSCLNSKWKGSVSSDVISYSMISLDLNLYVINFKWNYEYSNYSLLWMVRRCLWNVGYSRIIPATLERSKVAVSSCVKYLPSSSVVLYVSLAIWKPN